MYTLNGKQAINLQSVQRTLTRQMQNKSAVEYKYSVDLGIPDHVLEQWLKDQGYKPKFCYKGAYITLHARQMEVAL